MRFTSYYKVENGWQVDLWEGQRLISKHGPYSTFDEMLVVKKRLDGGVLDGENKLRLPFKLGEAE